jgi:outer membrane receptor protein involved in Fe transport
MKQYLLLVLLFLVYNASAQTLRGTITNAGNEAVPFATVQVKELQTGTVANAQGNYSIALPQQGWFTIKVSAVGFAASETRVQLSAGETKLLPLALQPDNRQLNAVEITAKSELRTISEQAFAVSAIDAKQLYNTTQDLNQVLNHTSGVRVREDGGLGSNFSFSLNGFTGKQVKFFMDGVPIDNLGSSFTINNMPVNMAEHIEVYKGVVPVWLGSDALGGAVNVVTNQHIKRYADVSYSAGSFNTHRASLNSRYSWDNTGVVLNLNGFFNYSDNSYKVDVQIPDPISGKYGPEESLRRFHDAYRSSMLQLEGGVVNKPFADRLLIGLIASKNKKDIQTGLNMNQVAGMAFNASQSLVPTLKYRKQDIILKGLSLVVNANYSMVKAGITDTSSRQYDWYGNYTVKTFGVTSGEISYNKTLFKFNDHNALASANLSYAAGQSNLFSLNYTYNRYQRQGDDPISKYPIPFDVPNVLRKNVAGLAYQYSTENERWSVTIFGKMFKLAATTVDAEWGDYTPLTASYTKPGYGLASYFMVSKDIRLKVSYESTWRLPEGEEMFGNGLLLQNNPYLRPEHSHNLNLGIMVSKTFGRHRVESELNFLYRKSGDYIRLESDGILSQYSNLDSVRTTGVEWTGKYTLNNTWTVEMNGTWQNIININKYDKGIRSYVYLDRLPNIPYLFGNVETTARFPHLFSGGDLLSASIGAGYAKDFYLFWPSQGYTGSKFVIPSQFTQNVGITYSLQDETYNLSVECNNLSNAKVYDNFRLQKPGRSLEMKVRYFIH